MASFIKKVQTFVSANLHALIDNALEADSVAVLDQYIREAEDYLDELDDALITIRGQVKTLERKWRIYKAEAEQLDHDIDRLLRVDKDDLALAAQSQYNAKIEIAEQYQTQYEGQKQEADALNDAKLKLEAKVTTIKQERDHLLALLDLAKSKEVASRAMRSLNDLNGIGDLDIARVGEAIRARLDQAEAEMESHPRLDTQIEDVLNQTKLQAQLAERRRRMAFPD